MNKRIFKRCLCGVLTAAMAATALVGFSGCDGGGDTGAGSGGESAAGEGACDIDAGGGDIRLEPSGTCVTSA